MSDPNDSSAPGRRLDPKEGAKAGLGSSLSPIPAIRRTMEWVLGVHRTVTRTRWYVPMMAMTGVAVGLGLIALRASNAASYLSDDPRTCINCHVMVPYYASWERSSHRKVATCNDCHVPHDNTLRKLWFKAMDGLRHATIFTLRREPQTLRLNPKAVPVVQQNCVRCHGHQVMNTKMGSSQWKQRCWHCHRRVPHGLAQSLSSTPHVRRPTLPSAGMPKRQQAPSGTPRTIFRKD